MTSAGWVADQDVLTGSVPHRGGGSTHRQITRGWIVAAAVVGACGVVVYGPAALLILLVSTASALLTEMAMVLSTRRPATGRLSRAALMGLLLGLTLPAQAPWYVAMLGAMIAISVGRWVFDSVIHPALTGRVVVQFIFSKALSLGAGGALATSSVLAPAHLLFGKIHNAAEVPHYAGWLESQPVEGAHAFRMQRPVQVLRRFAQSGLPPHGELRYEPLLRDRLPPWSDTLFGLVPGGIGETNTVALVIVGLFLIYRGFLRWQLPVTVIAGAFAAAAILPVELGGDYDWFPVFAAENGRSVGMAYVLYHLTSGQLMLGAFLLAGDIKSSPMRVQGQMLFGAGIGILTIFMRLYGDLEGECYWSIIIMNVLVGAIDRRMRRPVLGMPEE